MAETLAPLEAPYPASVADILSRYPSSDGYILKLFRVFANSERFLKKGVPNLLDRASPLALREREIVILRVTANRNCAYEWGVHVAFFAGAAGFSDGQVRATRLGPPDADVWSEREQVLLAAVDALCADGRMAPDLLARFRGHWNREEQLEIIALCGAYHTVSFVANAADLTAEEFAVPFPD